MSRPSDEAQRAERGSKILVLVLAGAFLFGMLGFALAALDADPERTEPPAPSLPAVIDLLPTPSPAAEASERRFLLALAETSPSPSTEAPPSPAPSGSPAPGASALTDEVAEEII